MPSKMFEPCIPMKYIGIPMKFIGLTSSPKPAMGQ